MLRKIYFIIFFLKISQIIIAQHNNIIELKSGGVFSGTGDIWGLNSSIKYQRKIKNHFSLFVEGAYSQGKVLNYNITLLNKLLPGLIGNTAVKINFGLAYKLFSFKKSQVLINPQFTLAKIQNINHSTAFYLPFDQLQEDFKYVYLPPVVVNSLTQGYGLGIEYKYILNESVILGLGLSSQFYHNGAIDHNLSIGIGYQF